MYVDENAPPGGDGTSWNRAFRDLQDALALFVAPCSGVILLADGVYTPDRGTGDRNATFQVGSGITIRGAFAGFGAPDPDLNDPDQFVSVLSGDLNRDDGPGFTNYADNSRRLIGAPARGTFGSWLINLTIRGARLDANAGGGAVIGTDSLRIPDHISINLFNCQVVENLVEGDNARLVDLNQLIVLESVLAGNRTHSQLPLIRAQRVMLDSCDFLANVGPAGSSVLGLERPYPSTAPDQIAYCVFGSNTMTALRVSGRSPQHVVHCTFAANLAPLAPAILASGGARVTLVNTIVDGNETASSQRPAILCQDQAIIDFYTAPNLLEGGNGDVFSPADPLAGIFAPISGNPLLRDVDGPDNNPLTWRDNDYTPTAASPAIDRSNQRFAQAFGTGFLSTRVTATPFDVPRADFTWAGASARDIGAIELTSNCPGDYLVDGSNSPEDFFAFLDDWFRSRSPAADLNFDNAINVQDVYEMVTRFFKPCDP